MDLFLPELVFYIFSFLLSFPFGEVGGGEIKARGRKYLETTEAVDKFIVFTIAGEIKGGSLGTEGPGKIH